MFDPYHKWLGIPKDQRPPTLYQLLGVSPHEDDPEVFEEASLMRIAHVRNYQLGPHAEECSRLLHELGEASATLCDPARRATYDAELAEKPSPATSASPQAKPEASPESNYDAVGAHSPFAVEPDAQRPDARPWDRSSSPPSFPRDATARYGPSRNGDVPEDPSLVKTAPPFHDAETPAPQARDRTPAEEISYTPPADLRDVSSERNFQSYPTKATHSEQKEVLKKLSDKALTELREPIQIEDESWWMLLGQMLREWGETLEEWGIKLPSVPSVYVRRVCTLAALAAAVWLVVIVARWLN